MMYDQIADLMREKNRLWKFIRDHIDGNFPREWLTAGRLPCVVTMENGMQNLCAAKREWSVWKEEEEGEEAGKEEDEDYDPDRVEEEDEAEGEGVEEEDI